MRPSGRPLAALATVVTGVGVGALGLPAAAQADTVTVTYFYSGAEQTFELQQAARLLGDRLLAAASAVQT